MAEITRKSLLAARDAFSQEGMFDALEFDGVVLKRHRIAVFKQRTNEVVDTWIARWLHQKLSPLWRFPDFAVLQDNFTLLDDIARMAEHASDVFIVVVQHQIGVASHAQVAL